eukprot:NODE_5710_length_917_cov_96.151134_g5486_i0.p1 GENE.NODE_5710_length_917_cov_96.151134_g5486_i0~~NODE_5710_length_917_cov_96.151134_g5486_i0.p1  ORF type:complete len:222 (-),score=24.73 NODE_5710_length_917_cov_96.151134_g5486_i0:60-725(-)
MSYRPPLWLVRGNLCYNKETNRARAKADKMYSQHLTTLEMFRKYAKANRWDEIHHHHFDWWMFPIDDGSRPNYNVYQGDIDELKQYRGYMDNYREGVRLAAKAWGWDVEQERPIDPKDAPGSGWTNWDVRLAKICRSLYLFEEDRYLASMQKFARTLKPSGGFFYGGICLDELLHFELPRRQNPSGNVGESFSRSLSGPTDGTQVACGEDDEFMRSATDIH